MATKSIDLAAFVADLEAVGWLVYDRTDFPEVMLRFDHPANNMQWWSKIHATPKSISGADFVDSKILGDSVQQISVSLDAPHWLAAQEIIRKHVAPAPPVTPGLLAAAQAALSAIHRSIPGIRPRQRPHDEPCGCVACELWQAETALRAELAAEEDRQLRSAAVGVLTHLATELRKPKVLAHINFGHSESYARGYNEGYDEGLAAATAGPVALTVAELTDDERGTITEKLWYKYSRAIDAATLDFIAAELAAMGYALVRMPS